MVASDAKSGVLPGMPPQGGPALTKLTVERTGLELELKVQQNKKRRRMRLIVNDGSSRKPWLSHDPAARVSDIVTTMGGDVLESDLTDAFKDALLTDVNADAPSEDSPSRAAAAACMSSPPETETMAPSERSALFADVDETLFSFITAAGVELDAPVRTRGAGDRRTVTFFDASSSLTAGDTCRRFNGGIGERRKLSEGCPRPECVNTRFQLATLRAKYAAEISRYAMLCILWHALLLWLCFCVPLHSSH